MKTPRIRTLGLAAAAAACALLVPHALGDTGGAGSAAGAEPASATGAAASSLQNSFERPAAGGPYALSDWDTDGWDALHGVGWDERTMVDDARSHDGGQSLRVLYPEGKIGPTESGGLAALGLDGQREYYLSFWVRFGEGFSWGTTEYAGKVGFGLAGGEGCSGGEACDGTNGFMVRPIWRQNDGQAAVYVYHMGKEGQYGDYQVLQTGGEDVHWPEEEWVNVVQRVKVNTVTGGTPNSDGEVEVFYNGESAAEFTGLNFVTNGDQVDKAYFSSFAGGGETTFAPEHDSYMWFDDVKVSTDPADICELQGSC